MEILFDVIGKFKQACKEHTSIVVVEEDDRRACEESGGMDRHDRV
jgi:hypothetical protein